MAGSQAAQNGRAYLENGKPTLILGISIGNPQFYKVENLQTLFKFAVEKSDKILLFLTEKISEHNFRAIGSKKPESSTRLQANRLRNKCKNVIQTCELQDASFTYVDWLRDVETSPSYVSALNYVINLYQVNNAFRKDILDATELALVSLKKGRENAALDIPIDCNEGIMYPLKELAFLSVLQDIYKSSEEFVFVYHRSWGFLEKFLDGDYDGIARPFLGFFIFE